MNNPLTAEASRVAYLRERLLMAFPELADDDQALADTLEGLSDFNEMCRHVIDSAANDKAMAAALKLRIADMQERAARFETREDRKRQAVAQAMEAAVIKKIEAPEFTISLRNNPSKVVITDETRIPAEFWKEKIVKTLDRTLLKEALETDIVPGAELSNGGASLTIRTK